MSGTQMSELSGDYLMPAFEHAVVSDVMRPGLFTCHPSTPLRTVARTMAMNHVHSVVVSRADGRRPWGIISDLDLVRFAADAGELLASEVATRDVLTVDPGTPLADAAELMAKRRQTHLVVVDEASGEPTGVVSALDLAGNIAWALG
jgi:CBS domain-containing protein